MLLVGESEFSEAGELEALRHLGWGNIAQFGLGGGGEGVPYRSEVGQVGRGSSGTWSQRPRGDGGVRA